MANAASAQSSAESCGHLKHAQNRFTVCQYQVSKIQIRTLLSRNDGSKFGSLRAAIQDLSGRGHRVLLLTNGGMYHGDLNPVGYYVENRRKLKDANTRRGPGNFHMMPNGIFFVERGTAGVMETRAFLKRNRRPDFATQSGPMLVINGQIHPSFDPGSTSRKSRNGVGVSADGKALYFAITNAPATFHAFASLFKDVLETPNALFLDGGSVPQMWARAGVDRLSFAPVGPVIAVTTR